MLWLSRRDREAGPQGSLSEIAVPGNKRDLVVRERQRGGEMDGVVAAQGHVVGELPRLARQVLVHSDQEQFALERLEVGDCLCVVGRRETIGAAGSGQGRATLWVREDAGRRRMGARPELGGQVRAILNDDELDQRRGVEVENQARCSETRSDTEPVPLT